MVTVRGAIARGGKDEEARPSAGAPKAPVEQIIGREGAGGLPLAPEARAAGPRKEEESPAPEARRMPLRALGTSSAVLEMEG